MTPTYADYQVLPARLLADLILVREGMEQLEARRIREPQNK